MSTFKLVLRFLISRLPILLTLFYIAEKFKCTELVEVTVRDKTALYSLNVHSHSRYLSVKGITENCPNYIMN